MWINSPDLKCVILCAGSGSRLHPLSAEIPKAMILLNNQPIIQYVIDYWKQYTNDFIFIVKHQKEHIIEFAQQLPISSQFVEQKELRGIADAVLHAKDLVSEYFAVVLGDCVCHGQFNFPENMEQGIGVWETSNSHDITQSYAVKIEDNLVSEVIEKPQTIINNLCGMGFYFFSQRVFDYIPLTKPSKLRNEIEITDVIENMILAGEKISPVFFNGSYLNITFPEDLNKALNLLFPS